MLDLTVSVRNDFKLFNEKVLGLTFPKFHYDVFYEWVRSGKPNACIELPRGHGKSTMYSRAYPDWRLYRETDFKICQFSGAIRQSILFADQIGEDFETKELLKPLVGKSNDSNWSKQYKEFTNGNKLFVAPFGPGARGGHFDLVDADDLLRDMDYSIEQAKEYFWGIVYPTVQTRRGNLTLVGTPQSELDLYHEIENKIKIDSGFASRWFFKKLPAVETDELGNWVKPLWPERFSLNDLQEIKMAIGEQRFAREYMLDPTSFSGSFYEKDAIINSLSSAYSFEYDSVKGSVAYGGSDFALSESNRADYSASFVVNVLEGEQEIDFGDRKEKIKSPIIVRYGFMGRGITYNNQIALQKRIYREYKLQTLVVDKTNFGIKIYEDLYGKLNVDGQDFPVAKRNALLMNLRNLFESGRLVLPFKDNELQTKKIISELVKQLKGFSLSTESNSIQSRAKHDDLAIALALAVKKIRPISDGSEESSYFYTKEDLVEDEEEALDEDCMFVTADILEKEEQRQKNKEKIVNR